MSREAGAKKTRDITDRESVMSLFPFLNLQVCR